MAGLFHSVEASVMCDERDRTLSKSHFKQFVFPDIV
jgi:hypothetical protein